MKKDVNKEQMLKDWFYDSIMIREEDVDRHKDENGHVDRIVWLIDFEHMGGNGCLDIIIDKKDHWMPHIHTQNPGTRDIKGLAKCLVGKIADIRLAEAIVEE